MLYSSHVRDAVLTWVQASPFLVFLLLLLTTRILYYVKKRYREHRADIAFGFRHGCQPPPQLPNRWPLGIDRLKELRDSDSDGRLLAFLCSVATDYEPRNNLSQFILFGPRMFHVMHPRNMEAVLSTNFKGSSLLLSVQVLESCIDWSCVDYGFGVRHGVFSPLLGTGTFTQEGSAWKHSRELLRKQFARIQSQKMDHFREHVDNLIARLPVQEGVVDLQPLFFSLTLDTTTAVSLGQSVYSLRADAADDAENRAFAESFDIAQEGLAKRFRIAPWHFLYCPQEFRRACSIVHRYVERYVRERDLQDREKVETAEISGFINQVAQDSSSSEIVRDQLLNVLLAGRDTTACCLSWTFRLLVRHSRVLNRLRGEILSVMEDARCPSREEIRKMPYLAHVIQESLRLYPSVPLNNRTATRTTVLPTGGGPEGDAPVLVRRGEVVTFSQYVNSRRKNIYGEDADAFRPERWETGELANIGWAYFPFSGGPRTCLGRDFALMEVSYTVVRLLMACPLMALPAGEQNEPVGTERQRLTLVLSSADRCRVQVDRSALN